MDRSPTVAHRIQIYTGPPLDRALAAVPGERSARINTICDRYMLMVEDELSRVVLTKAEWLATFDAQSGELNPTTLWANVHDSPGLGTRWGVDQAALAGKLQRLPKSTLMAIAEACDRFCSRADKPRDEALAAAGVTPID